jgi:predicted GIY-YIG superfamily endonuclease
MRDPPEGRHEPVYDADIGDFTQMTFKEYTEQMIINQHPYSDFILNGWVKHNYRWKDEDGKIFTVYLIRCNDEAYYVGQAADYEERIRNHVKGTKVGAKYIKEHGGFRECISLNHVRTRRAALELEKCISQTLDLMGIGVNLIK